MSRGQHDGHVQIHGAARFSPPRGTDRRLLVGRCIHDDVGIGAADEAEIAAKARIGRRGLDAPAGESQVLGHPVRQSSPGWNRLHPLPPCLTIRSTANAALAIIPTKAIEFCRTASHRACRAALAFSSAWWRRRLRRGHVPGAAEAAAHVGCGGYRRRTIIAYASTATAPRSAPTATGRAQWPRHDPQDCAPSRPTGSPTTRTAAR